MPNFVPASGPLDAKIMIIGEAPGEHEDRMMQPFVGGSGQLLNACLQSVGIERAACYLTNVVKTRPPSNNFGIYYEDKSCRKPSQLLERAWQELYEEIKKVNPNVIIALGGEALRALTGKRSIESWRGSIIKATTGHKVVAAYHPAYILKMYEHRPILELDLKRALDQSTFSDIRYKQPQFSVLPNFDDVMAQLGWIQNNRPRISLDVESSGRVIRCLGIGWDSSRSKSTIDAICIPFACRRGFTKNPKILMMPSGDQDFFGTSYWSLEEEQAILTELEKIFLDLEIPKVLQNFPFDSELLWKEFGLHIRGLYMDTMVAQHCCYSELPKSLDFLTSIYTEIPYYADYDASNDEQTFIYNAFDCVATVRSSFRLDEELRQLGLSEFYHNHAQPEMEALARLQNRGLPVSEHERSKMRVELQAQVDNTKRLISERIGKDFNPRSHVQMKKFLYEELALPEVYDRKTKKLSSDKKALEKLIKKHPEHEELLSGITDFKSHERLIKRFLTAPLRDGKVFTSFNATGTVTGRISSSENIWGEGDNLQNINRGPVRRIFAAPDGHWWIKVDLSQAEARAVAWLAKLDVLIKQWHENPSWDIHTWNAAEHIFRVPADTITKEQRYLSKCGVHGGNYGLREIAAAAIYKIPLEDARRAINGYQQAVGIEKNYWKPIQAKLLSTRMLRSPLGRLRIFFDRINDETFRSAYSTVPQSIVADSIGRALVVLDPILRDYRTYPISQVHDELNFICPKDQLENVMPIIVNVMQMPIDFSEFNGVEEPLVIPAEASYGPSWYDKDQTPWSGNE